MARPTTIALVGVHGYGAVHLDNLRRLGDRVRLVAAADPREPDAGTLPSHTRVFPDLAALLAATDGIDVVIVATPLHTHLELARLVVSRGIDLYLEKPPVLTLEDLHVLEEAAARSGARVQVGFQSLGSRALAAFAADRFDLGPVRAIGAVGMWSRDRAYWQRSRWAGRRELDGVAVVDGVTTNPLAHATATALALAGASAARGLVWSMTWWAPSVRLHSAVSGREAVAITVRSVSCRASWVAMEPTPPAPPTISSAGAAPGTGLRRSSRSNRASQAVIAVSGIAAASAKDRVAGFAPTIRSSTR